MKYVLNFIKGIVFGVWLIIAIFSTICLISRNDYGVSVFGKTSLLLIDDEDLSEEIKANDLVIVKSSKSYEEGDYIFFYNSSKEVNYAKVNEVVSSTGAMSSYVIDGGQISEDKVIGSTDNAKVYKNCGFVLNLFESRWGFMFLVILPTLYLLVYEIFSLVVEVKKEVKRQKKELAE